jgi:hypothetical protein
VVAITSAALARLRTVFIARPLPCAGRLVSAIARSSAATIRSGTVSSAHEDASAQRAVTHGR